LDSFSFSFLFFPSLIYITLHSLPFLLIATPTYTTTMLPPSKHSHRLPFPPRPERQFRQSHSFPLTSSSSHTGTTSLTGYPSEHIPHHAPIPEDWIIQLPSSPTQPPSRDFQPEVSLLVPQDQGDDDGMSEGDRRLWRAASRMLANSRPGQGDDNDMNLLAQPHLIDFGLPSNSQSHSHSQASTLVNQYQSQVLQVISPFRIHSQQQHLSQSLPHQQTSSPAPTDSDDDEFDTPLSERRRRRRLEQGTLIASAKARVIFGTTKSGGGGGGPLTPSPIRFSGQIRSASKFSSLDDEDEEKEGGRERERELWSPEFVDMEIDTGGKELGDMDQDVEMRTVRELSAITVVLDTPLKSVQGSSPKSSEFELKEEEEDSGKLDLPVRSQTKEGS
jgi:hypothetical protein